jgi:hypothetical protein
VGGNAAQRREHDKRIGAGTMSRSGASCPCCGSIMTMEDIRLEGRAGRLGAVMTAVVVDGKNGKEYRLPKKQELEIFSSTGVPAGSTGVPACVNRITRFTGTEACATKACATQTYATDVSGLDDITTYYLLHRHDYGMGDVPSGAAILYAVSCGLSDSALADQYDILIRTGGKAAIDEIDGEETGTEACPTEACPTDESDEGSGSAVKLKEWHRRARPGMGYDPAVDSPRARRNAASPLLFPEMEKAPVKSKGVPLIDQAHRLMHLWKAGEVIKVDEYLDLRGLRRNNLFHHLIQALVELSAAGSEERSLLESISNHIAARGVAFDKQIDYIKALSREDE